MSKNQETTSEFSQRLNQAVEGHPLAPQTPFGRQSWLREKLAKEAGLEVSPNSIHKWVTALSRPREDSIRLIARVLAVDDVWLSMGRRPVANTPVAQEAASSATGATMVLAGLVEMNGGKATFPDSTDESVSLFVNMGSTRRAVTVVQGQTNGGKTSFMVPEPVGDNRIVTVVHNKTSGEKFGCFHVVDLTDSPRQNFGGFSVIQGQARKDGQIKVEGQRNLVAPVTEIAELLGA